MSAMGRSAVVKNHSATTSRADVSRMPAFDTGRTSRYPYGPGINFSYPDRPYGDPGRDEPQLKFHGALSGRSNPCFWSTSRQERQLLVWRLSALFVHGWHYATY